MRSAVPDTAALIGCRKLAELGIESDSAKGAAACKGDVKVEELGSEKALACRLASACSSFSGSGTDMRVSMGLGVVSVAGADDVCIWNAVYAGGRPESGSVLVFVYVMGPRGAGLVYTVEKGLSESKQDHANIAID